MRKIGQRRAVDYTSTVLRYMQVITVECGLLSRDLLMECGAVNVLLYSTTI